MDTPGNTHRTAIIGRTGSGKTQFGVWYLGKMINGPWREMPVTIFDFKRAKLLGKLPAKQIDINKPPPKKPGLYITRPEPVTDDKAVIVYLTKLYENTGHGLYFDEAYELGPRNRGYRRLLTQGRELEIPMIYCTQRPVNCDRYALSEADYMAIFQLRIEDDRKTIENMVPTYTSERLAKYHCHWYCVNSDEGTVLRPCPSQSEIISLYTSDNINRSIGQSTETSDQSQIPTIGRRTFL